MISGCPVPTTTFFVSCAKTPCCFLAWTFPTSPIYQVGVYECTIRLLCHSLVASTVSTALLCPDFRREQKCGRAKVANPPSLAPTDSPWFLRGALEQPLARGNTAPKFQLHVVGRKHADWCTPWPQCPLPPIGSIQHSACSLCVLLLPVYCSVALFCFWPFLYYSSFEIIARYVPDFVATDYSSSEWIRILEVNELM